MPRLNYLIFSVERKKEDFTVLQSLSYTINLKLKTNRVDIKIIAFTYRYEYDRLFNDAAQTHMIVKYYHVYPFELDFLILLSTFISIYLLILIE